LPSLAKISTRFENAAHPIAAEGRALVSVGLKRVWYDTRCNPLG